ncbi:molybdopterin-dependent oxidoreductase [Methylobacterium sp. SyP6R]|uniref:molybdopterin-dependent oxidoreductase n=1 Tax=Methylobacterium sp. SyP6R TaxID=2718876 RepID=UPI001F2BAD2B|nr:molybdopterin-dependent oxidoreductase [Methylobacterium sp. SyP6R]MCF4124946.1 molybdopterin-dependent oxidoreductase [Methylobacterium sp. SyP6R]
MLAGLGLSGLGLGSLAAAVPAWAAGTVKLPQPGGPDLRDLTTAFPGKGPMILQRTRPPLLETPFEVFDQGVFTPNDRFYVRWHWASIPTEVDANAYRLTVRGHVDRELSLSLDELARLPRFEIAAVNQCSGNSRGLFEPRVPGAQWANGSMGNARWTGVRLKDVLDRAGVKGGAVQVRFSGLDEPVVDDAPDFKKSLDLDHARDGEVMLAYAMNGEQLPLLNGFPLRLVVPGWYSTYWVKMLSDIEVLDKPDDQYWMKTAYRIPDVPGANIKPGQTGFKTVPINRMVPRAFVTNLRDGARAAAGSPVAVRGIAFGGDCGVRTVEISADGGATWSLGKLGADEGPYSFRRFEGDLPAFAAGTHAIKVRCTNTNGLAQPMERVWNGAGFMQNGVETVSLHVA